MALKRHPDDPKKWIITWYVPGGKGKRGYKVVETTEPLAREFELSVRKRVPYSTPTNPRIASCVDEFYHAYKINRMESTYNDCKRAFAHLLKTFSNFQFSELNPALIDQYKGKRLAEGVKPRTINRELTYFGSFLTWAVENNLMHPLTFKIKKFTGERIKPPKPRIPHPKEMEKIISKVEPEYKLIVLLLYDTGMRRHEALKVKGEDVHLKSRLLTVLGKGGKEEHIPITTERLYKALVKACKEAGQGHLSVSPRTGRPYNPTAIKNALNRAAKAAKVSGRIYPHLLRHSFGTHATVAGLNPWAIKDILRHADIKTTQIYTHMSKEFLQTESKKFANWIGKSGKRKVPKKKRKS